MSDKQRYLTCLFFFKMAVGALLLLIGWDAIGLKGDSAGNVAMVTLLAFAPAAFARPLYWKISKFTDLTLIRISLFSSFVFVLIERSVMFATHAEKEIFYVIHFLLWIFIFLNEVTLERWFVTISKSMSDDELKSISGSSMAVIQFGIILGPILAGFSKNYSPQMPYYITAILFFIPLVFIATGKSQQIVINVKKSKVISRRFDILLAFSLIWPTLAVFNMAVPLVSNKYYTDGLNVAVALEVALALGSALAGVFYSKLSKILFNESLVAVGIAIICLCIEFFKTNMYLLSISIFLLGLFYGTLRISSRAYLAKNISPDEVGNLISKANALSSLLVAAYLYLFYIENKSTGSLFVMMIAFVVSSIFFVFMKRKSNDLANS